MSEDNLMIKQEKFKLWCKYRNVVFIQMGYIEGDLFCEYAYPMFLDFTYSVSYTTVRKQLPELAQQYFQNKLKE